jgi:hypothetical protein
MFHRQRPPQRTSVRQHVPCNLHRPCAGFACYCRSMRREAVGRKRALAKPCYGCIPLRSVVKRVSMVQMHTGFALNDMLGQPDIDFTRQEALGLL